MTDQDPAPPPLKLLADMAAIFADPAKLRREIDQFENSRAEAERAEASLATARAEHEAFVQSSRAELDATRSQLARRELALTQREGRLEVSERRQKEELEDLRRRTGQRIESGFGGGSMTQEFCAAGESRFGLLADPIATIVPDEAQSPRSTASRRAARPTRQ